MNLVQKSSVVHIIDLWDSEIIVIGWNEGKVEFFGIEEKYEYFRGIEIICDLAEFIFFLDKKRVCQPDKIPRDR